MQSTEATLTSDYSKLLSQLRRDRGWAGDFALASFTIAGVQDFVAAARTTRDVWNGSYLINHLAASAGREMTAEVSGLIESNDAREWMLLPNPDSSLDKQIASFPNTILMLVPGNLEQGRAIARAGLRAANKAWEVLAETCREAFDKAGLLDRSAAEMWKYQTDAHRAMEFYATAVDLPADDGGFDRVRVRYRLPEHLPPFGALLEWSGRILNSRKLLRDFEQVGEEMLRCSLCGARAALANYPEHKARESRKEFYRPLREYWEKVRETREFRYRFRVGERLCAVCVIRRIAPLLGCYGTSALDFPSTSSISAAYSVHVLFRSDNGELDKSLQQFRSALGIWADAVELAGSTRPRLGAPALPFFSPQSGDRKTFASLDGDWFFEDYYDSERLVFETGCKERPTAARDYLKGVLRKKYQFSPDPYYALLRADGDSMGDRIGGAPGHRELRALSRSLADFSGKARKIVEADTPGKLVYAGGDDMLAFVPCVTLLETMQALHQAWPRAETGTTLSMAAVLAHHNHPLSDAIEKAQILLKKTAKEQYGRDAFVVWRTTAPFEAGGRFGGSMVRHLLDLQKGLRDDSLSPRIAAALGDLAEGFSFDPGTAPNLNAQLAAIQPLIGRQCKPEFKEIASNRIVEMLIELHQWAPDRALDPFQMLVNLLTLLRFLSRKEAGE